MAKQNIDWEQRRYEIAKAICIKQFSGLAIKVDAGKVHTNKVLVEENVRLCVEYADIFINELKKEN